MCENQQIWVFCENPKCDFEGSSFSEEEIEHIKENQCPCCEKFILVAKEVIGGVIV